MNRYTEMKRRHQKEFNDLPIVFAFGQKQFREMMERWGLDPEKDDDKICEVEYSGYIQKKDLDVLDNMLERQSAEMEAAIAEDRTGDGFIYQMFLCELDNHDYSSTGEFDVTLEALGYIPDEINADRRLRHGLERAAKKIMNRVKESEESIKFYWFTFADGYRVCCRGFSAQERRIEESKHGRIVSRVPAGISGT